MHPRTDRKMYRWYDEAVNFAQRAHLCGSLPSPPRPAQSVPAAFLL